MAFFSKLKSLVTGGKSREGEQRTTERGTAQVLKEHHWTNVEKKQPAAPRVKQPEDAPVQRRAAAPEEPPRRKEAKPPEETGAKSAESQDFPQASKPPQASPQAPPPSPDQALIAHGYASRTEYNATLRGIALGEPIEARLQATPHGRAALIALRDHPELIQRWMDNEPGVPPSVAMGLRLLWSIQQHAHGDGKSLLRKGDIEGLGALEVSGARKQALNPVTDAMRQAVTDCRDWMKKADARKAEEVRKAHAAKMEAEKVKEGDTIDINGVTYQAQAGSEGLRYHRVTPRETGDGKETQPSGGNGPQSNSTLDASASSGERSAGRTALQPDQGGAATAGQQARQAEANVRQVEKGLEDSNPPAVLSNDKKAKIAAKIIRQACEGPPPHVKPSAALKAASAFDHQIDGALRIASAYARGEKGFMLADGMGSGKTITMLAAIQQTGAKRALVVVPNRVLIKQWIGAPEDGGKGGDLRMSGLHAAMDFTRAESTTEDYSKSKGHHITTYSALMDNPSLTSGFDLVVFDECQNIANQDGATGQAAELVMRDSIKRGGRVLFGSATPYQKMEQMKYLWPLGLWPDDPDGRGFDTFARAHGVTVKKRYKEGKWLREYEHGRAHSIKLLGLHQAMIERGNYLHREMRLDGLTNTFRAHELAPEHRKLYDTVMSAMTRAARGKPPAKARTIAAQRYAVAMRMLESFMVPHAIEAAKKEIAADEAKGIKRHAAFFVQSVSDIDLQKILSRNGVPANIASQVRSLRSPAEALVEAFGGGEKVMRYYGASGDDPREYNGYEDSNGNWVEPSKRIAVVSYAKGGTGLSLHDTRGDRPRSQYNLSVPYSALKFTQATARSHRLSTKGETQQYFLLADGVEESKRFARITASKLKNMGAGIRGLTGGDAGAAELMAFEAGEIL